jgi:hypothetical protein
MTKNSEVSCSVPCLALEDVYARTRIGDFDFEKYGRPVDGLMSLGTLIQKLKGMLAELYARTRTGDCDFDKYGTPVVERAIEEVITKSASYSNTHIRRAKAGSP